MSVGGFLVILILAIVALMFLIIKANLHPVFSLLIVAFVSGIALGFAPLESIGLINDGFAGTLKGVGIPIILGAVLAMGVQDTGAAKSIGNFFIKLFRGKNLELAPSLTAFIVSIPVFGDITMVLTSNIASVLSRRKGISMSTMATFTGLGLFLTHAMVPPTPGILAISILLGADLGMVILIGILVAFIAFIGSWLLLRKWTEKEMILPNPDFVKNIEPAKSDNVEDLLIDNEGLPGAFASFVSLLIPVVLIAAASFANMYMPEGNVIRDVLAVLGDKVVALSLAVIYTMFLGLKNSKGVIESNKEATGKDMKSMKDILLNSWVTRGLEVALSALLITAMGGAFGQVIKSAPAIELLGPIVAEFPMPGILIPWLIGAVMMTSVGSMTTAGMTAAAIVLPMMTSLGISPLAATLAIGAGTLMLDHVNNSGFWVMSQFFNLNTQQGLKYITIPGVVASVISMIALLVLTTVGII
jgi:GntP family gluconate:H+ symporter